MGVRLVDNNGTHKKTRDDGREKCHIEGSATAPALSGYAQI